MAALLRRVEQVAEKGFNRRKRSNREIRRNMGVDNKAIKRATKGASANLPAGIFSAGGGMNQR